MTDGSRSPVAAKYWKPKLPLKVRLSVSLFSAITDASRRADGTINRGLVSLLNLRAPPKPTTVRGVSTIDLKVDPSHKVWFRLFLPSDGLPQRLPLIVFFHGGGFDYLSPDNRAYDLACRRIARKIPAVVASVNYRLAPEHRYPAPYEDGFDVLRFVDSVESTQLPAIWLTLPPAFSPATAPALTSPTTSPAVGPQQAVDGASY